MAKRIIANVNIVGNLDIDVVPNAVVDTDKFLVQDADGIIKYRTGSQLYDDINAGEEVHYYVKNSSGATIPKGTNVRFSGTEGNSGHLLISKFIANGSVPSQFYMGVTAEDIPNGGFGKVVHFGELYGINTSSFQDGDILYASTTVAGGFQNTIPTAPNNIVLVAAVVNAANNGVIFIRPTIGSNINNDEGVKFTDVVANQGIFYNGGYWVNKTIAQALGYTPADAARTLSINGTSYDLSANRSWTVGDVRTDGSYANPSWITSLGWSKISSTPTTLSGYGITDAVISGRKLTINGTEYDLSADRSWSVGTITALTGEVTASGTGSVNATLSNSAVIGKVLTGLNLTGGGTILSTDSILQAFGKVQNQISALVGGVTYQGVWDASTNSPAITSSVGSKGQYYVVNVAGSTNIDGITDWKVGDWIIYNGSTWDKVDNTDAVSSVNGYTGAVSLSTSDILEGTNLYYTNARARGAISLTTTGTSGVATYDSNTGVLNIPQYQAALTNPITGIGTANYLAKFTGSGSIGNSLIQDDGTNLGINTAPEANVRLKLSGTLKVVDGGTVAGSYVVVNRAAIGSGSNIVFQTSGGNQWDLGLSYTSNNFILYNHSGFNAIQVDKTNNNTTFYGNIIKNGGTSSQFLKADGSVDSNTYLTSSSLTGYIPYTGATSNVNLGTYALLGSNIVGSRLFAEGDGTTDAYLALKQTVSSASYAGGGYTSISPLGNYRLLFNFNQGATYKMFSFDVTNLSSLFDRVYSMPNASGTLALTSDIPSLSGYVQGSGTTNYVSKFTASGTIGNSQIFDNGSFVGIGTTTEVLGAGKLQVAGGATFSGNVTTNNNFISQPATGTNSTYSAYLNDGGQLYIGIDNSTGSAFGKGNYAYNIYGNANRPMVFSTDGTARLTIAATTGAATFSSSVTATDALLNKTSTQLILQNTDGGTNAERIGMFMTGGDIFKIISLNDNNTTRVDNIITANVLSGNVGIGTASPYANLDLGASGANNIILRNTSSAFNLGYIGNAGGRIDIGFSNTNTSLSPLPYLSVNTSGYVLIGSIPVPTTDLLQVAGSARVAGQLLVSYANPDVEGIKLQATTGTNAASILITNTGGNFYIGRDKSDGSRISGTAYANAVWAENSYPLVFGVNNTERMRITSAGNLGVGTSHSNLQFYRTLISNNGTNAFLGVTNGDGSDGSRTIKIGLTSANKAIIQGTRINVADDVPIYLQPDGSRVVIGNANDNLTDLLQVAGEARFYQPLTSSTAYLKIENNRSRNAAVYTATTNGGFYAGTSIGTDTFCYQIYDAVAGAERMRITSGGNVGIGTTSPSWKLHIEGTTGTSIQEGLLALKVTNATHTNGILFINSGNTSSFNDLAGIYSKIESGNAKGYLGFYTRNSDGNNIDVAERMRITSAGRLLLGTTNGNLTDLLQVAGSGYFTGNLKGYVAGLSSYQTYSRAPQYSIASYQSIAGGNFTKTLDIVANADSGADSEIRFLTTGTTGSATERMRITSAGNVGIGVSTMANWDTTIKPIEIGSSGNFYGGYNSQGVSVIYLGTNAYYNSGWKIANTSAYRPQLLDAGNGEWNFQYASSGSSGSAITWTSQMKITNSGRLLLGTTTDNLTDLLQVAGRGRFYEELSISTSSGDHMRFIGRGASDYSDIVFYATNNSTRLGYIDWSNTQARWNVEANIPLVFYTNSTERMRITSGGQLQLSNTPTSSSASSVASYLSVTVNGNSYLIPLHQPA